MNSLQENDIKYIWHPFTQMQDYENKEPLIIDKGEGIYLFDIDGNKYIDGISSLWTNVFGHKNKTIDNRIKSQLDKIAHSTLLGLGNTASIELAEKLIQIVPKGLEKIFYSDNGSTSVEIAIKMAYQYCMQNGREEKKKTAHIVNSYHGDTLGSVSVGGIDLFHKVYKDLIFETVCIDLPEKYRYDGNDWQEECFRILEDTINKHAHELSALVIEPLIQGASGMMLYPSGYLKKARELTKENNIFLIVDEVATGFGRTGTMFACEHENVVPDIMCLAKGLSGGYLPLAATITTKEVYEGFLGEYKDARTFFHGHTYTGNPLACSAGLGTLEIFEKENIIESLQDKIKFLKENLQRFYELDHVGEIRQKGFMCGIELVLDKENKTPYMWEEKIGVKVICEARKQGAIIRPLGNVIVLMPPLSISCEQLKTLLDIVYESIKKVTEH